MSSPGDSFVLIDSDLDLEGRGIKKPCLAVPPAAQPAKALMALFTKPFMQASDDESDDSGESEPSAGGVVRPSSPAASHPGLGSGLSDSLSGPSVDFSDLEEAVPSEKRSGLESAERPAVLGALKQTVYETRKYLKDKGIMAFLQDYLPPTASSEDIASLITKLGFVPKNLPPLADGENLLQLIKLLHLAMKKVRQLRPRLENFTSVDHVLSSLRTCNKILVITGAGISTSLGIPDFRSSQGFYSQISNLGLSDPQEVFDLEIFHSDPSIFYSIAHMILPPDNIYAPLHKFIKLLQDKGKLLRNYSQNIDNLEANAGIDKDRLVQCHGSFGQATCVTCHYEVDGETIYPAMRRKEIAYCPKCAPKRKKLLDAESVYVQESYGVMKPNITFFGEALPARFHLVINQDLRDCDLVISIGTSLKVAPVAEIVERVPASVPQVLINRDPLHHCNFDVSLLGYCDEAVSYLCAKLGESWHIDHPNYSLLIGEDHQNLLLEMGQEKGVYKVSNKQREALAEHLKPVVLPEPDFVVLEPTIE